jgi:hypothetical protein
MMIKLPFMVQHASMTQLFYSLLPVLLLVTMPADASVNLLLLPVSGIQPVGMDHRVLDVVLLDVVQDVSRRLVN